MLDGSRGCSSACPAAHPEGQPSLANGVGTGRSRAETTRAVPKVELGQSWRSRGLPRVGWSEGPWGGGQVLGDHPPFPQGSECPDQERCHAPVPGVPGGPPGGDAVPSTGVRCGPARARPRRHDPTARGRADGPQPGHRVAGKPWQGEGFGGTRGRARGGCCRRAHAALPPR